MLEELNFGYVKQNKPRFEVAVLPVGAIEPHNYHLPYGNDFLTTRAVAERVCEEAWNRGAKVLLLPALPYGVNNNMLEFPYTVHVGLWSLGQVIRDIIASFEHHGVRKFVIFNGHGGNSFKALVREWHGTTKCFVCVVDWWTVGSDVYDKVFDQKDDHAGEMETSVALVLHPQLVQMEQADEGRAKPFRFEALRRGWAQITRPWHLMSDSSGSGDPRGATAEKGQRYLQVVTDRLAQFLLDLSNSELDDRFPFAEDP